MSIPEQAFSEQQLRQIAQCVYAEWSKRGALLNDPLAPLYERINDEIAHECKRKQEEADPITTTEVIFESWTVKDLREELREDCIGEDGEYSRVIAMRKYPVLTRMSDQDFFNLLNYAARKGWRFASDGLELNMLEECAVLYLGDV